MAKLTHRLKIAKRSTLALNAPLAIIVTITLLPKAFAEKIPFTILHTNDLHSSFEGNGPDSLWRLNPKAVPLPGHYARLACTITNERAARAKAGEQVLLFDAGDFFGGTAFHAIGPSLKEPKSPELEFFQKMGYNAITLGNHDFDATRAGLARMLAKARNRGFAVPVVESNLEPIESNRRTEKNSMLFPASAIVELKTKQKPLKVGILGILSPSAIMLSKPTRGGLRFAGYADAKSRLDKSKFFSSIKKSFEALRNGDKPDLVVALLHGGEVDTELAKKVPGIDLIISGHTHETYLRREGKTIITQAGAHGESLGRLSLVYDTDTRLLEPATASAEKEHFIPTNANSCIDNAYLKEIASLKDAANRALGSRKFSYSTPIYTVTESLPFKHESKLPLGRFVWSNVRSALNRHLPKPVDLYLGTLGVLRGEFRKQENNPTLYQFSDIFRILSLGFETVDNPKNFREPEIVPGSPVVVVYLKKNEFKTLMEFLEIYGKYDAVAIPATSDNVDYTVRWWGIPLLNRLGDFRIDGKPLDELPDLISVGTTAYIANFFTDLRGLSYGLVRVTPRNERGEPLRKREIVPAAKVPREYELLAEALLAPAPASTPAPTTTPTSKSSAPDGR